MADEEERLMKTLIGHVSEMSQQLGTLREQVKEDVAQSLVRYREDVHRATMGLHTRMIIQEKHTEDDRAARADRQKELDAQLAAIRTSQLWRMRIEVALIVAVVMLYLYFRR